MSDAQFSWAKSLDTGSAPYSNTLPPYSLPMYPYNPSLNYGPSDYNVGKAFKLYGMWQPVLFHSSNNWAEKVVGGWTLSGILIGTLDFPGIPYARRSRWRSLLRQLRLHQPGLHSTWAARVTAPATISSRRFKLFLGCHPGQCFGVFRGASLHPLHMSHSYHLPVRKRESPGRASQPVHRPRIQERGHDAGQELLACLTLQCSGKTPSLNCEWMSSICSTI